MILCLWAQRQPTLDSIFVEDSLPLLALHRALDSDAIRAVMIKHWHAAGKTSLVVLVSLGLWIYVCR